MTDHYSEFRAVSETLFIKSSPGLIALLKRNGIEPTTEAAQDLKLARQFMPKNYKGE